MLRENFTQKENCSKTVLQTILMSYAGVLATIKRSEVSVLIDVIRFEISCENNVPLGSSSVLCASFMQR